MMLLFPALCLLLTTVEVFADDGDKPPKPPKLPKMPLFSDLSQFTNLHVKSSLRTLEGKIRFFDEYYERTTGKGRVDMEGYSPDVKSITLYNNDTMQTLEFKKNGDFANCRVSSIKGSETNTFLDYIHVDHEDGHPVMYGPLTVWRKLSFSARLREKRGDGPFASPGHHVRGVRAIRYRMVYNNDEASTNVVINLYFMDESCKKYENTKFLLPLKFEIAGIVGEQVVNNEIEFFIFEEVKEISIDPIIAIGCKGAASQGRTSFNGADILRHFPSVGMTMKTIYTKEKGKDADDDDNDNPFFSGKVIHHHELFMDSVNKVVRFSQREDRTNQVLIQDLRRGISYIRSEGESCDVLNLQETGHMFKNKGKFRRALAKSLPELLFMSGPNTYYLGRTRRRGILCDVFEQVLTNHTFDLLDEDVRQDNKGYDKAVITHFISARQNLDLEIYPTPVSTLLTGYEITSAGAYKSVFSYEINYFNFRNLTYEEKTLDIFDVSDCVDPINREYFDLYIKFDGKGYFATDRPTLVQGEVAKILASSLNLPTLRIAKVILSTSEFLSKGVGGSKTFVIKVLILERPPAKLSFHNIAKSVRPAKSDIRYKVRDVDECALHVLEENGVRGYYWCHGTCFTTTRDIDLDGAYESIEEDINCDLYSRTIRPENNAEILTLEPTLSQVKEKLMNLVKNHQLSFTLRDDKTTETYIVDDIIAGQKKLQ